jgi:hypothetical protein
LCLIVCLSCWPKKFGSLAKTNVLRQSFSHDNPLYGKDRILKSIDKSIITIGNVARKPVSTMEGLKTNGFFMVIVCQWNNLISQIDQLIK